MAMRGVFVLLVISRDKNFVVKLHFLIWFLLFTVGDVNSKLSRSSLRYENEGLRSVW